MSRFLHHPRRVSDQPFWNADCPSGKCCWASRGAARREARRLDPSGAIRAFKCPLCGQFHTGHALGHPRQWHRELHAGDVA